MGTTIADYFATSKGTASSRLVKYEAFKVIVRVGAIKTAPGAKQQILQDLTSVKNQMGNLGWVTIDDPNLLPDMQELSVRHAETLEQLQVCDHEDIHTGHTRRGTKRVLYWCI
ncbi:hypothetical protein NDU88_005662 [Pleurodeles waltl]|uniref:Uncharacterized protein n=1 Tax=Pleurodeles waltl TaxID=8319 RepID=A0AAV7MWZ7_PLEWA|nr:hypothetical protein NDU88_005662 [Pleurodeles waltl]